MAKRYDLRRRERKESLARKGNPRVPARAARESSVKTAIDTTSGRRASRGVVVALCILLVLGTALTFVQTAGHKFVNCDDHQYLYENANIQRGLTPTCAWWAITQAHSANWHPLTWMSHALDWQLFGKWDGELNRYVESWPGGHHLVNLALHGICVVLLYLVLQAITGATWPSAAVAALFAVHPQHVESVAWATGRKDTLSALFFLLTVAAYHAYAIRAFSWRRYTLVIVSFALGLMAKPMLVTVPFVLLLLDFWPLQRIRLASAFFVSPPFLKLLLEKLPLLALSVGSCFLTRWAQSLVGAFKPLEFQYRAENALISYAAYIGQMFWPTDMVVQYVHKGTYLRMEDTLLPLAVLLPVTLAAVWFGWRRRHLLVGWFWYVGMLVPVIGLVQVGAGAGRPLHVPDANRPLHNGRVGTERPGAWLARPVGRVRRVERIGARRAGCRRLAADLALAKRPPLVGTQRRLPAEQRLRAEFVRRCVIRRPQNRRSQCASPRVF